jgi:hypothetical protein
VPSKTPESADPASAPVGAQVTTLATTTPTSTTPQSAGPAPVQSQPQPDQGRFSGQLPSSGAPAAKNAPVTSRATPPPPPAQTAAQLPKPSTNWANDYYRNNNAKSGYGNHNHQQQGQHRGDHRPHH